MSSVFGKRGHHLGVWLVGLASLGGILGLGGCSGESVVSEVSPGRELAVQYCASCHQLPEPELLPKKSWEFLLTYMGFFLGVVDYSYLEGVSERTLSSAQGREEFLREANLVPDQPAISDEDWADLRAYYIASAPEVAIPQASKPELTVGLPVFATKETQYDRQTAITSLVHIDSENGLLLVGDSRMEELVVLDRKLKFLDRHLTPDVFLIDALSRGSDLYLLSIGDLFASKIGVPQGQLLRGKLVGEVYIGKRTLLGGLHRPSDFTLGDVNNDGSEELLVCNFGDYTGDFSIYQRDEASDAFLPEPQVLSEQPGIVKCETFDFNEDGHLDIAVLMSHARENFSIFLNQGDGAFSQKVIMEQHPSFGYTGFQLVDFNRDGLMDLVTINGDNGDSDPYNTLKRDHGIRIYLNRGDLQFAESYFYPMYGVFGAEIDDFDLDGDYDIAAIAYHPDFNRNPPEYFVYLEQTGALNFAPRTHPETFAGRWMTIDSGDLDGDGDSDIVLGAAYLPVGMIPDHADTFRRMTEDGPALLVLENRFSETDL